MMFTSSETLNKHRDGFLTIHASPVRQESSVDWLRQARPTYQELFPPPETDQSKLSKCNLRVDKHKRRSPWRRRAAAWQRCAAADGLKWFLDDYPVVIKTRINYDVMREHTKMVRRSLRLRDGTVTQIPCSRLLWHNQHTWHYVRAMTAND